MERIAIFIGVVGDQARARIFAARIDFESRDPASGTLWFFDAEGDDGIEGAEQLRSDFARFIAAAGRCLKCPLSERQSWVSPRHGA